MQTDASELPWTGERYVPHLRGDIALEHLHRYALAAEFVKEKRVLDMASGEGYGSEMLAREAVSVVGVDIDKSSIAHAQKKYQKKNLTFQQGSCEQIPLSDHSVDVVVSFETIEHLADHEKMLQEIKRVLTSDGLLIVSTPDKHEYTEVPEHHNQFHVKELYKSEFKNLLGAYFKNQQTLGQRIAYGSNILNVEEPSDFGGVYEFNHLLAEEEKTKRRFQPLYLIAFCSDAKLPSIDSTLCEQPFYETEAYQSVSRKLVEKENLINEQKIILSQQNIDIQNKDCLLAEKENLINQKNKLIREQEKQLETKEEELQQQENLIQQQKELIAGNEGQLQNQAAIIHERELQFVEQERQPIENNQLIFKIQNTRMLRDNLKLLNLLERIKAGMAEQASAFYIARNNLLNRQWCFHQYFRIARVGINFLDHHVGIGKKGQREAKEGPILLQEDGEETNVHITSHALKVIKKKYGSDISLKIGTIGKALDAALSQNKNDSIYGVEALKKEIGNNISERPTAYDVSIIIPVHNQLAYTLACVASILSAETKCAYEILIADDASTDETAKTFEALHSSIKLIHRSSNLGFLRNCNEAAKQAQGKYILFLNNDTLVLPGGLDALVDIFKTRSDAGFVGAKLLNADGTLQEAGGIIWKDGSGWNYGRNDDPEKSEYNYVREVDYCSGACIMIEKKLWEQLEGFDPLFSPAYCEDSDLAFRVRAAGKKVYYQPKSEVIHLEGKSHGKDVKQGVKSYQIENNKKLFQRWKNILSTHAAPGKEVFKQRERGLQKRTILVIDHYLPQYDQDAGARTIWSYIKFFAKKGFIVKFLGNSFLTTDPYYTQLQQMGVEVLYNGFANQHWQKWLKENGKYIDYVFLSRAHIAVNYVDLLKKKTEAKLLFYGHDLLSRTFGNKHHLWNDIAALANSKKWKKWEEQIINAVDVTYYPSQVEIDYLRNCYPNRSVKLLPPYVLPHQENKDVGKNSFNGKLLFVGGFRHLPNVEAMNWFTKKIWPSVKSIFPEMKLTIAGSHPPKEIIELRNDDICVTGFVSDQELAELYQTHDIIVVPLLTGGGIKNKVIEALWHGKPVLTTPIGAEGIPGIQNYVNIAEPADFLTKLKDMVETPSLLKTFSKNASELIRKHYSEEALYSVLSEDIDFF